MEMKKIFKLIASQMAGEFELVKLQPEQLRGRTREVLIRRFLEPFLPESLGIASGVITSVTGEDSGEIDIVIYDKSAYNIFRPFSYYMPERFRLFPSEVVYAVIEVEHKLTPGSLQKCVEKIEKVKKLPKKAFYEQIGATRNFVNLYGEKWEYFPILGLIFSLDTANLDGLIKDMEKINKENNLSPKHQTDLICVFKKGIIVNYDPQKDLLAFPWEPGYELRYIEGAPEDNLSLFYQMIMRILTQAWTRPIIVSDYFKKKH